MAYFESWVATDNTGQAGSYETAYVLWADFEFIQIAYEDYYTDFWGNFYYDEFGFLYGDLDSIDIFNYNGADISPPPVIGGDLLQTWEANPGDYYPAETVEYILFNGTPTQYMQFLFALDDEIYGSKYNDRLAGWDGNDFISGWKGKDKLWGGNGFDTFYFGKKFKKDTIMDFDSSEDVVAIHKKLAKNYKQLKKAADNYKKGVIFEFSKKDKLKIEGYKKKDMSKDDFDFV